MKSRQTHFHYTAFLSYSHVDANIAKRVHRRLESFTISKDLVGHKTSMGPIPASLKPVFFDRAEFGVGESLSEQTREALLHSGALLVLASPNAKRSHYVDEEVRLFRQLHPDRPLIPLIVKGPANLTGQDVFPPAMCFLADENGILGDKAADLLAADARDCADGVALALAKVVARLIGVDTDEIFRRAQRESRRRARIRNAIASFIAALCISASLAAWHGIRSDRSLAKTKHDIVDINELASRLLGIDTASAADPESLQNLKRALAAISAGASVDSRYEKALHLLDAGKTAEATPLLEAYAASAKARVVKDRKQAAAAYRNLGAIANLANPKKARDAYAQAVQLDPDNIAGLLRHGYFEEHAGNLAGAKLAFLRVINLASPDTSDQDLFSANIDVGDVAYDQGDLTASMQHYVTAAAIASHRLKLHPRSSRIQREMALAYREFGKVLQAEGNSQAALTSLRSGLRILDNLARHHPTDVTAQREFSRMLSRLGELFLDLGSLKSARKLYTDASNIAANLAQAHPDNITLRNDLALMSRRNAAILAAQGYQREAEKEDETTLATISALSKSDPENLELQAEAAAMNLDIGTFLLAQGEQAHAMVFTQAGFDISNRLASLDSANAPWQHNLSVSYRRMADTLRAQGENVAAEGNYRSSLEIAQRLTQLDLRNVFWRVEVGNSLGKLGDARLAMGDGPGALAYYQKSLSLRAQLTTQDSSNMSWQIDLAFSYNRNGQALLSMGKFMPGLKAYQTALALEEHANTSSASREDAQFAIAVSCRGIAAVSLRLRHPDTARVALQRGKTVIAELIQKTSQNTDWNAERSWFEKKLAAGP